MGRQTTDVTSCDGYNVVVSQRQHDWTAHVFKLTQEIADKYLASCIRGVEAVAGDGHGPWHIVPSVRLTNNRSSLGTCKMIGIGKRFGADGKNFQVSISRLVATDEERLLSVMYHEVIHACPGCFNHGAMFKGLASKVERAYGVAVETTYHDSSYAKPNAKLAAANAAASSAKARKAQTADARLLRYVGTHFVCHGREYVVTGIAPNARKYTLQMKDVRSGKAYRTDPRTVSIGALGDSHAR